MTPLHVAAERGRSHEVKFLAKNGANVNAKNYKGVCFKYVYASITTTLEIHLGVANLCNITNMIVKVNYINIGSLITNSVFSLYQQTPLHIVAKEGYEHTVRYLCESGADITLKDKDGVSICDYIDYYWFKLELVSILLCQEGECTFCMAILFKSKLKLKSICTFTLQIIQYK